MRRGNRAIAAIALLAALATPAALAAEPVKRDGFEIESLAPGVHLYRHAAMGARGANSLVVERADGLLVIGAQPSPDAATALLAAIAKASKKPVRYLVLTHPHAVSSGGASAFPAGTLVIASDAARERLADAAYDVGAEERARAADPAKWAEPPRVLPVLHAAAPLTLDDPDRRAVIVPLRPGHSRGDLWVELPGTGVIAVGGLVTADGNPYAADADVHGWIGLLNDLARDDLTAIVSDSGRVLTAADVRRMRDAFAWTRIRVQQAFTDLVPHEEIVGRVLADPGMATRFDLGAKPSFLRELVQRIFDEVMEDRRRRGMP